MERPTNIRPGITSVITLSDPERNFLKAEGEIRKVAWRSWAVGVEAGPVRHVIASIHSWTPYEGTHDWEDIYWWEIAYGVPDPRVALSPGYRGAGIQSEQVKRFLIFGKVVRVEFRGSDFLSNVIERLNQDGSLTSLLLKNRSSPAIDFDASHRRWVMAPGLPWFKDKLIIDYKTVRGDDQASLERELRKVFDQGLNPGKQMWEIYTQIAIHLLAARIPA